MKRILVLLLALAGVVSALAQTPEEIISRMEAVMDGHEKDGIEMVLDLKIPILGTFSTRTWTLEKKTRMEMEKSGVKVITWIDGDVSRTYDPSKNEITITRNEAGKKDDPKENDDMKMFDDITGGYTASIKKETASEWQIVCRKSRSNTDKDAPKTMDLTIAKGSYLPRSLSAKAKGVTFTIRDLSFGVSESQVTFNPADYPTATMVDKR